MNVLQPRASPLWILINKRLMHRRPNALVVYIAQSLVKKLIAYLQSYPGISYNIFVPPP